MADDLVKRAREVLEGTTPGPWHWNVQGFVGPVSTDDDQSFGMICDEVAEVTFSGGCKESNARLIASAPTLIADMAARIEALTAERDTATARADALALPEVRRPHLTRLYSRQWRCDHIHRTHHNAGLDAPCRRPRRHQRG